MKKCSMCKTKKPKSQFNKRSDTKDGLSYWCRNCLKTYHAKHYLVNKKEINAFAKSYYQKNKEHIIKKVFEYGQTPKGIEVRQKCKQKQVQEKYGTEWSRKQRATNPLYNLLGCLRGRINKTISFNRKSAKTIELLGCSIEFFKFHLESKFLSGMNWENRGKYGWHIDHIKPCSSFDLSKPEEQKKCFHYTNLQPLWAIDNLKKFNKIYEEQI